MKPYYESDGITIYHADALEVAGGLPQVDALVLDPPFFMPAQHYAARSAWARAWGDQADQRAADAVAGGPGESLADTAKRESE